MKGKLTKLKKIYKNYPNYKKDIFQDIDKIEFYDLFPDKENDNNKLGIKISRKWNDEWINSQMPGIYLIFSEDLDILYVGKASM